MRFRSDYNDKLKKTSKGDSIISTTTPVGLLVGTSLLDGNVAENLNRQTLTVEGQSIELYRNDGIVVRQRHDSPDGYRPPHRINHQTNLRALEQAGVVDVLSINSVGSLQESLEPGTFIVPDDYINPWSPVTFHDDEKGHGVRRIDPTLRQLVIKSLDSINRNVHPEGVYLQTTGPRFETPAEADMFTHFADVIGMTAGSEITLASELGLNYVTLCSIDNYVNGIAGTAIDLERFEESVRDNLPAVLKSLKLVLTDVFDLPEEMIPFEPTG